MKKILAAIFIANLVVSCAFNKKSNDFKQSLIKDTNGFDILVDQFSHNIEKIWGFNEVLDDGQKNYIKYTDSYQTRSHIDFEKGTITIETVSINNPVMRLRQTIVETLLMNDNFNSIGFYYDRNSSFVSTKKPFLYSQVVDQTGKPIFLEKHANNFADYLLKNFLKKRDNGFRIIYSVTINLVSNHISKRAHKYINIVRKASRKYGIDESLILAIMQTESSFNPYAVSHSDALGLMQIVQNSAGKDVFRAQGKRGIPSRSYLFDPESNIDTGTAYLAILNNIYLSSINNLTSRLYAVIAAYNSGAGSVLRVFSEDKIQAANIINSMSPNEVYIILTTRHPSMELRRYLYKVNTAQKNYCIG